MRRQISAVTLLFALTLVAGSPGSSVNAAAKFNKEEAAVAKKLEEAYGVRVLRIHSGLIDGATVYIVTVMNPAGDFNAAFQVTTLAVDKTSGRLVSDYRQTPTGQRHSGAEFRNPPTGSSGPAIRRWTERRQRPR